jgi:hypothetical protein
LERKVHHKKNQHEHDKYQWNDGIVRSKGREKKGIGKKEIMTSTYYTLCVQIMVIQFTQKDLV